jgi:hypothetical protein
MLDGILNHLVCNIVEEEASFILANSFDQAIIFLQAKGELNLHVKVQSN